MTHLSPTQQEEYKKERDSIIEGLALANDWVYSGGTSLDMPKNSLTTPQARDRFDALLNEYIDKAVIEALDEVLEFMPKRMPTKDIYLKSVDMKIPMIQVHPNKETSILMNRMYNIALREVTEVVKELKEKTPNE